MFVNTSISDLLYENTVQVIQQDSRIRKSSKFQRNSDSSDGYIKGRTRKLTYFLTEKAILIQKVTIILNSIHAFLYKKVSDASSTRLS